MIWEGATSGLMPGCRCGGLPGHRRLAGVSTVAGRHGGGGGLPLHLTPAGIGFAVPPFPAPAGCCTGRIWHWGQCRRCGRSRGHRSPAGVPRLAGSDQRVRGNFLVPGGNGGRTERGHHPAPPANPCTVGIDRRAGLARDALASLVAILPLYLGNKLQTGTAGRGLHAGLLIAVGLFAKPVAGLLSDRLGHGRAWWPLP